MDDSFRIIGLTAENVKCLKAVRIVPDGNVVEITGQNGNGKSSILDSIIYAIGGKEEIPEVPIRVGEEKAVIVVEMNGISVKRTFRGQEDGTFTTALTVETADGMTAKKPQDYLNALIGELSFDPLAFTRMKAKEQFDILKRFVPDFDFDEAAKRRKKIFDDRTLVNRQIKEAQGAVASAQIPDDVPDEEIDVSALTDDLQAIGEFNAGIETRKGNRERVKADIQAKCDGAAQKKRDAEEMRKRADLLDKEAADLLSDATALQDKLDQAGPLPEPKDAGVTREKINDAHRINALVRQKKALDAKIAEVRVLEQKSVQLSKDIEALDAEKTKAVSNAKMPVEGIGFGDDVVYLNGLPFSQASSAEQLRAAVALTIAANPRLRVVLIRDGSLLDHKAFEVLSEMAKTNDFQVFVEVVESNRPGALVIEAGEIRSPAIMEAAE